MPSISSILLGGGGYHTSMKYPGLLHCSSVGFVCFKQQPILYFPIPHNALKFCVKYCCEMFLGGLHIPKRISQQQFMQNLGANRVRYGELENREFHTY